MLNVFMMSYLQLVQGSSYEHGPVKVGGLIFNVMQSFLIGLYGGLSFLAPHFPDNIKIQNTPSSGQDISCNS